MIIRMLLPSPIAASRYLQAYSSGTNYPKVMFDHRTMKVTECPETSRQCHSVAQKQDVESRSKDTRGARQIDMRIRKTTEEGAL
jgi:hypothetical protein